MSSWKPTLEEKRAIRVFAAKSEGLSISAIVVAVGERYSLHPPDGGSQQVDTSTNILSFGLTDGQERSDLNQTLPWTTLNRGIELVDGEAVVDFYVYERGFGTLGDLRTNVQAHVTSVDGTPRLWKLTGTGVAPCLVHYGGPSRIR